MKWKSTFAAFLFLAVAGATSFNIWNKDAEKPVLTNDSGQRTIQLAGKTIKVSTANTPEARTEGLGGRISLAPDEGMLFVFDTVAKYQFWMKAMLFPIDILWLSDDGKVVDMRENASPATYPEVFTPNVPARYVLELPAGFAKDYNIAIGDTVRF